MDFPLPCPHCRQENIIDIEKPFTSPVGNVNWVEKFLCENCGLEFPFFIGNQAIEDAARKLGIYKPGSTNYQYHFLKLLKKAMGVREKYGQSIHSYQTIS